MLAGAKPAHVVLTDDPLPLVAAADAVIDFTRPAASVELAALAAQARIVHVIGTTGFSADDEEKIRAAARHATSEIRQYESGRDPARFSGLARGKGAADFDIEIVEMHHRLKVDAPSGPPCFSAMRRQKRATCRSMNDGARPRRQRARTLGAIGFASLRGGTVVGEHEVVLAGQARARGPQHVAEDRAIFARGAIAAAKWGMARSPGLYTMQDVLGLPINRSSAARGLDGQHCALARTAPSDSRGVCRPLPARDGRG